MGRQCTTGTGRKPKQYKRISVDYTHKLQVLHFLDADNDTGKAIAKLYPLISTSAERKKKLKQISSWRRQRKHIELMCSQRKGHHKNLRKIGEAIVLPRDAEEYIVLWLNSMRREGCPVSAQMLQYKALEVASERGFSADIFTASYSWRKGFMRRHRLSIRVRTRQGQTTPEDAEAAAAKFRAEVREMIVKYNISTVLNADQTAVFFEYLPTKTITTRGEKTVWVKCGGKEKERATVMLLADWQGKKYPPFIIFRARNSTCKSTQQLNDTKRNGFGSVLWSKVSKLQQGHRCQIYGNSTAWWNSKISLKFLRFHFSNRQNADEKLLLLWDDFSGHWTQEVVDYAATLNVILMKVPPRYTYVCQPADIAWNQPFKTKLRGHWLDRLRKEVADHHAMDARRAARQLGNTARIQVVSREETQDVARQRIINIQKEAAPTAFRVTPPNRGDIVSWIATSWESLTTTTIIGGFAKVKILGDMRTPPDIAESETCQVSTNDLVEQIRRMNVLCDSVDSDDDIDGMSDEEVQNYTISL